jgi:DNA mismatch endonuclease (patch repair protein)
MPRTNRAKWQAKFEHNVRRDKRVRCKLQRQGWSILTLWECQVSRWSVERIAKKITRFLDPRV